MSEGVDCSPKPVLVLMYAPDGLAWQIPWKGNQRDALRCAGNNAELPLNWGSEGQEGPVLATGDDHPSGLLHTQLLAAVHVCALNACSLQILHVHWRTVLGCLKGCQSTNGERALSGRPRRSGSDAM